MKLRFLVPSTLMVALSAISFGASADPVDVKVHDNGIIEFSAARSAPKPAATPASATSVESPRDLPATSSGASLGWAKYRQEAADAPKVAQAPSHSHSGEIDRSKALGIPARAPLVAPAVEGPKGHLAQLGREGIDEAQLLAPVAGWADQVPLEMALAQVVPSDWTLQARKVDLNRLVSWRGDRPWVEVLSDLTRAHKFNANVVWDKKVVVVFPLGALDGTAATPLPAVAKPAVVEVAPVVVPVKSWRIDPALTLRGNIELWVKEAGWNTLVWEAADYPIVAPAVLTGDFTSPTGPLAQLIDAYRNSDQPLEVTLSTLDKVVHVTNKNYEPAIANPLTPQDVVPASFNK